jgi:CheY-like chemotaxis protein
MLREVIVSLLEDAGFTCAEAADGEQAVAYLKNHAPDLVVLDIVMPKLNGWGVLDHIRTMTQPPRVVVSTGMAEVVPPGHLSAYLSGALLKPFSGDALIRTCEAALAPATARAGGLRKEDRRTFVIEATVLSETGAPLVRGRLVELSRHGFRLDVGATCFEPGDRLWLTVSLPGAVEPLRVRGRVRWRSALALGAEIEEISPGHEDFLRELIEA